MGFHGECGRGWSSRCVNSKGPKCRCKCGGANHGKLRGTPIVLDATQQDVIDFAKRHANYEHVDETEQAVTIRDLGPWDRYPTITNDAEHVVARLGGMLRGRSLLYYDSDGNLDELLVKDGKFAGFAPGPQMADAR